MSPSELASSLHAAQWLDNLQGKPCPAPACENTPEREGRSRTLGKLVITKEGQSVGGDLTFAVMFHRCATCRQRCAAVHRNPLLGNVRNLSDLTAAWWNCVEGISATSTARQLQADPDLVSGWYQQARRIMRWDALRRQAQIRFGCRGCQTTDIEADESKFAVFKTVDDQGVKTWHWLVYLGVRERGDTSKLWLHCVGLKKSEGEPRIPPLPNETWSAAAREVFSEDTNAILFTDGAACYREVRAPGVVQHEWVNHSLKEFARSCTVLNNTEAPAGAKERTRPAMAGTMTIDHEWKLLKEFMPPRGLSARTAEGRDRIDEYVRQGQWSRVVSTYDRWECFVRAAADWKREEQARATAVSWKKTFVRKRRLPETAAAPPLQSSETSSCPGGGEEKPFDLEDEDEAHPALADCKAEELSEPDDESATLQAALLQEETLRSGSVPPPQQKGWMCGLLNKEIGIRDLAPPWFNDPRTGAVNARRKIQTALTCGHALQHLLLVKDESIILQRAAFEALCQGDFDEQGNYEYSGMHRNLEHHGCSAELVGVDIVETLTYQCERGAWSGIFAPGTLEGSAVLGYLLHVPGHWVALVPGGIGGPDHMGMLCDSLYDCIFHVTGEEIAELLEAMALHQAADPANLHGEWSAYRVYVK